MVNYFWLPGGAALGWQVSLMAQPLHPHPQEDAPDFLFLIIFLTTRTTAAAISSKGMMLARLAVIHESIGIPPFLLSLGG